MICENKAQGKQKSQKLDEGVSQASDWRFRREQLESASPVAFADIRKRVQCTLDSNLLRDGSLLTAKVLNLVNAIR